MSRILTIVLFCGLLAGCNSANSERPSAKYEEKKQSLEEMERSSPLKFLKVAGAHHSNLLNQIVVEGDITNSATLVTYKNIELQVSFLDKGGSVIEKQKTVIEDIVKPNSTTEFKVKMPHVKGANSVSMDITGALADK